MPATPAFAITDPFHPVLKAGSPTIQLTPEQDQYVKAILEVSCSDSRFAQKAYAALFLVLTNGEEEAIPPVLSSMEPSTLPIDIGLLMITLTGTGFTAESVVVFNSIPYITSFNSDTSLQITVETIGQVPGVVPVVVDNEGVVSNSVNFTFTAPALQSSTKKEDKK